MVFFQAGVMAYDKLNGITFDKAVLQSGWYLAWMLAAANVMLIGSLVAFGYVTVRRDFRCALRPALTLMCILLIVTAMFEMNIITEQFRLKNLFESQFALLMKNPVGIVSMTLLAPVAEELLFRVGIEGHLLKTGYRPWLAIVASAALFSLVHGNPAQMPGALAAGLLFGWLYYRIGSPVPGILGHIVNNALAVWLMLSSHNPAITTEQLLGGRANLLFYALFCAVFIFFLIYYLNRKLTV
jgi:membrane protease YdiL (CAAX protease family)